MYKIVCFTQIYNEIRKGNLERFVKYVLPLVDDIVVYDDCSTDGSYEFMLQHTKNIIRGGKNDFRKEMFHKQELLELALTLKPDFILWLDVDEVLSANCDLQTMCQRLVEKDMDGMRMRTVNLWRSVTWERVDSMYSSWSVRLWRVTDGMLFNCVEGLHNQMYPVSITKPRTMTVKCWKVLHFGFSTDAQLAYKFFTYRKHGQKGFFLYRILMEQMDDQIRKLSDKDPYYKKELEWRPLDYYNMKLEKVYMKMYPPGLFVKNEAKPEIREFVKAFSDISVHQDFVFAPGISFVCNVKYDNVGEIKFFYEQFLKHTPLDNSEFYFRILSKHRKVKRFLDIRRIPYFIGRNVVDNVRGYYIVILEPWVAVTKDWLSGLLKDVKNGSYVQSTIYETDHDYFHHTEKGFSTEFTGVPDIDYPFSYLIRKEDYNKRSLPKIVSLKSKVWKIKVSNVDNEVVEDTDNKFVICNDYLTGRHGEKVLWDKLLSIGPNCVGVDMDNVKPRKRTVFERWASAYIRKHHPTASVILQNCSFLAEVRTPGLFKLVLLQDNLVGMDYKQHRIDEQFGNLNTCDLVITNSQITAAYYPDYHCEVVSLGINTNKFRPLDKIAMREKHGFDHNKKIGIFVGAFHEVKGWSLVEEVIKKNPDMFWILVTKNKKDSCTLENTRVFKVIEHDLLVELINCADFFILGSPVETQCLAALEAGLCDVPVVMRNTGIFADFTMEDKNMIGVFTENLENGVKKVLNGDMKFEPRKLVLDKGLTDVAMLQKWIKLLQRVQLEHDQMKLK